MTQENLIKSLKVMANKAPDKKTINEIFDAISSIQQGIAVKLHMYPTEDGTYTIISIIEF